MSQNTTTISSLTEKLQNTPLLDMVFVIDATGSMGSYIAEAQRTISSIVESIVKTEKSDVRFALVSYRDHPPQDSTYVTKGFDFTASVATMRKNLDTLSASGGGDGPEAVVDGLQAALKLDYRPQSTKICILIADAPPHGLQASGDGFPAGCPCGLDPMAVCRNMAEHGIALYCIGCEPSITPYRDFFTALAHITGGQYCPLGNASALSAVIVGGAREEIALEQLMDEVAELSSDVTVQALPEQEREHHVWSKLREKNVVTKQLRMGASDLPAPSADAIAMSKATSLAEARTSFKPAASPASASWSRTSAPPPASPGLFSKLSSRMTTPPPMAASMAPPSSSEYNVEEAEISMAQVSRMMKKSVARSGHY
jgi:Mg-chelatase subunit ChlD